MKRARKYARSTAIMIFAGLAALMAMTLAPMATLAGQDAILIGLENTTLSANDARVETVRALIKGFSEREAVPGVALLLAQHGRVVFREAYGFADLKTQTPLTVDSMVLTASVTKPLSATCVMNLVDQGKISLDDKASKFLPAFDNLKVSSTAVSAASPTIRQLLSHTSGLFGLKGATKQGMRAVRDLNLDLDESVAIIAKESLVAKPGDRFNYGGANYQVAAKIGEQTAGQAFDQCMKKFLFQPLNMDHTYFRPGSGHDVGRVATVYKFVPDNGLIPIAAYGPDPGRRLVLASGGLYSSLNDLGVFLQMHLNKGVYGSSRILTPSAVAEMQKQQTPSSKIRYGLGWFIDRTAADGRTLSISHPGLFGSLVWIDLDRDLIGVFLTSSLWPGRKDLHKELRQLVYDLFPAGT